MQNGFARRSWWDGVLGQVVFPLLIFALVLGAFIYGLENLNQTTQQEQLETARKAIVQATVQCYAQEGFYPPSYEYLAQHYGLQVDTDKYLIHYNAFASNIIPEIMLFPRY